MRNVSASFFPSLRARTSNRLVNKKHPRCKRESWTDLYPQLISEGTEKLASVPSGGGGAAPAAGGAAPAEEKKEEAPKEEEESDEDMGLGLFD